MNLKKYLRNKAASILACATPPIAAGLFRALDRHRQTNLGHGVPWAELHNPDPKMVQRNSEVGAILAGIRRPCSLNIQAKYETLSAGRPYSVP
jgi:hypothetical protein